MTHCVVWSSMLLAIEAGLGKKIQNAYLRSKKKTFPMPLGSELELDEDVLEEEKRVMATPADELQIKVENLRKVYLTGAGPCD